MAGGLSRARMGAPSGGPREERGEPMEGGLLIAPPGCLWPTSYYTSCGAASIRGRLCGYHLTRVLEQASGWGCTWPGCRRLSSAGEGLCAFHTAVATGQTGRGQ